MELNKFIGKYLLPNKQTTKLTNTVTDLGVSKPDMDIVNARHTVKVLGGNFKMGSKLSLVRDGVIKGIITGMFEPKGTTCRCPCHAVPQLGQFCLVSPLFFVFFESHLHVNGFALPGLLIGKFKVPVIN